jgi:hypothetical protein
LHERVDLADVAGELLDAEDRLKGLADVVPPGDADDRPEALLPGRQRHREPAPHAYPTNDTRSGSTSGLDIRYWTAAA